jgi:signal transduction histidine kinase
MTGGIIRSTRAQLIALLLGSLLAAQCLSIGVFARDRDEMLLQIRMRDVVDRLLHVASIVEARSDDDRNVVVRLSNSQDFRIEVTDSPLHGITDVADRPDLLDAMQAEFAAGPLMDLRLAVVRPQVSPASGRFWDKSIYNAMASARLSDGTWLTAQKVLDKRKAALAWQASLSLLVTVVIVVIVVWLIVERITRPLKWLSHAAERFGQGQPVRSPPVSGPSEMTTVMIAFEEMTGRITRLLAERSRTLAAIGHDLMSPITAMQLRIEMIDDEETRVRIEKCLSEILDLVQAALTLSRAGDTTEQTVDILLEDLLGELVEELQELGGDASLASAGATEFSGRRSALKRAIRNVAENAIRYGAVARITLSQSADCITIRVEDDGPGIPPEDRERVFEPFVRLESSRSKETGGCGLGLAIAKSIIDGHAGTITFETVECGGCVLITLPRR